MRRPLSTLAALALGAASHAQLVFGSTTTNTATAGAWSLNVDTARATRLWNGPGSGTASRKVNGIAADGAAGTIYGADAARFYKWSYGGLATLPTTMGGFYRRGTNNVVYATGIDDLAFAQGALYAYTNYNASGGANVEDGIYRIDTTASGTASAPNMTLVWRHDDLKYNFKGLAYDPASGLFYGANASNGNPAAQNALGVYRIDLFGSQAVTKVADFDASFLDNPDGLAVGGGRLWLSGKASGTSTMLIESFSLATHAYGDRLSFDLGDTGARATGLTWAPGAVPEPASMLALGLGAAALVRRRRAQAVRTRNPSTPA